MDEMADLSDIAVLPNQDDDEPELRTHASEFVEQSPALIHALPQARPETVFLYVEGIRMLEIGVITQVPAETDRPQPSGSRVGQT